MLEVTEPLLNFSSFLNDSWGATKFFLNQSNDNFNYEDWLQANWEILVETKICLPLQFLQYYGNGADCYGEYSRVTYYDKAPTHKIIGSLENKSCFDYYNDELLGTLENYTFHSFLNIENKIGDYNPPFDYVEFEHDFEDKRVWLSKTEVRFLLIPIIS